MRQKDKGMWLSDRESEFIDTYRKQSSSQKRATRKQISKAYDEKIESSAGKSKKKR